MSGRVFLHIGCPKTGTTFLQQVLWSQRDLASRQRVLLPGDTFNDHFLACMDLRGRGDVARSEGAWGRLVEEVAGWRGDALVSHELFAGATEEQVATAVRDLSAVAEEVHVVVTARDLARQVPAEWQEHLKHRSTLRFDEFVRAVRHHDADARWFWLVQDVAGLARRWGAAVGSRRLHVVTVPASGSPPELLWGRFAATVGLQPESFSLEVRHANSSVGLEQAELLRRLNEELGAERLSRQGAYPVLVKDRLAHEVLALRPGTRLELTPDDWQFAVDHGVEVGKALTELGVDVVGDLEELVPSGPPPAGNRSPEVTPEAVLTEAVAALAASLEAHDRTRVQLRRTRERLEELGAPIDPEAHAVRRALVALSRRYAWAGAAKELYKRRLQRRRPDHEPVD